MSIVSVIRLIVGLAMVAGGVVLCVPLTMEVVSAVGRQHPGIASGPAPADGMTFHPAEGVATVESPPVPTPSAPVFPMPEADLPPESGQPLRSLYSPPVPPAPLAGPVPAPPAPEVEAAYRSMADIPPPALLDAQRPPSPVSWSSTARSAPTTRPLPDALVPASCIVRDGDDLEGIATRYYGHPSAASAIWGANRERIPDPRILPIGLELQLPPPWTVMPGGVNAEPGSTPAIEPPAVAAVGFSQPMAVSEAVAVRPAAAPTSVPHWLAQPVAGPQAVTSSPARPAVVRLAPGETLVTVARRFYGDERMAERIWQANRDRLRAPELVVPGMEIRLP